MSEGTGAPAYDRIVEIEYLTPDAKRGRGTGYLIAPRIVLTAGHVARNTGNDPRQVKVRQASREDEEGWAYAEQVVLAADVSLDAAVVVLDTDWGPAPPESAGLLDVAAPVPFHATGFPYASQDDSAAADTPRKLEVVRGTAESILRTDSLQLNVTSTNPAERAPAADGRARSSWGGLSGAAVFGPDNLFIGIVGTANTRYREARLQAVGLDRIVADRGLRPFLPEPWCEQEPARVSHHLALRIGLGQRLRLRSPRQDPWPFGPVHSSPAALLAAGSQIVPYIPREAPYGWLDGWCAGEAPQSYAVLSGQGGAGKSRLAAELCARMAERGWVAGMAEALSLGVAGPEAALADLGADLLLVLDYADHRQTYVAELLQAVAAAHGKHKVRVLLIVRDGRSFRRRLAAELGPEEAGTDHDRLLSLADEDLPLDEREKHYAAARKHFAAALGAPAPPEPEPAQVRHVTAALPTPLLVHARALLDLLDSADTATDRAPLPVGQEQPPAAAAVLVSLLYREDRRFWRESLGDLLLSPDDRRSVLALSTLVGADTEAEAIDALAGAVPLMDADPGRRRAVAHRIRELYGGRFLPPVEPDLLGEQLIADALADPADLLRAFDQAVAAGQRSRALEVLLRMCGSRVGSIGGWAREALTGVLRERRGELVVQAAAAAGSVYRGGAATAQEARHLPTRLAAALDAVEFAWEPTEAVAAATALPAGPIFQPLVAAIYHSASRRAVQDGDLARAAALEARTALALTTAGRLEAAEAPVQLAQSYLAMAPSHVADPTMARVLSAGSIINIGMSRAGIALDEAQRAVEFALAGGAEGGPENREALLQSRFALVLSYAALARYHEAAEAARVACAESGPVDTDTKLGLWLLYAQMMFASGDPGRAASVLAEAAAPLDPAYAAGAAEAPARDRYLAQLLFSRAMYHAVLSQTDEAQHCLRGAESIADALIGTGDELSFLLRGQVRLIAASVSVIAGDGEAAADLALDGSQDVYELYRRSPEAYGNVYAFAEATLARTLSEDGRFEDAVAAAVRGRQAAIRGFADHPALYLASLAETSIALADAYARDGEWQKAAAELDTAYERVGRLDPAVIAEATSIGAYLLRGMADLAAAAEDAPKAVSAAGHAVDAYAALVRGNDFPAYLLGLIGARLLHLRALGEADREDEAVAEAKRTLADAERLMVAAPNDQSRRILVLARWAVASGNRLRGESEQASDLLRQALQDFVLDQETAGDRSDQETLRQLLREIESPAVGGVDDSIAPESFADLGRGEHRVVLGRWKDDEIAARAFRPVLVLGPQRSRKTTGVVIPTLLEWDGPALVTSVRSDVVAATIGHRADRGKTWVFEPAGELFADSPMTTSWNPVEGCENFDQAVVMSYALTEASQAENARSHGSTSDNRWWYEQATLLIQPLLHAAALSRLTMADVSRWIRTESRAEVQARLTAFGSREAVDIFRAFSTMAEVTRSGVYATARNVLRVYESEAVRSRSKSGFSVPMLFEGANTLYLCAPPEEQERMAPIFTALVRSVINEAYRRQAERPDLLLLLDEAGNIAPVQNLDTVATTAAGTRIQLVTVFHDISQLMAIYGPDRAYSIVNNHAALLVLPGNRDVRTMDLIERILADEPANQRRKRSVRQLKPGTALCVYDHLPVEDIALRSSTHDSDLIAIVEAGRSAKTDEWMRTLLRDQPA